jgi:hypothetical protein
MKPLFLLFAFAVSGVILAQDPAAPSEPAPATPEVEKPAPAKPAATPTELPPLPDPAPVPEDPDLMRNQPGSRLKPDPSLIPERIPARPGERTKTRSSTLKPPTTSADLDARIRFRQAHTRAANEPAIQALWTESRVALTDYEKRDALRRYYNTLYKRIVSFDKGLKTLVDERQRLSLRRLDQTRIDPTDPLDEEHRQRRE